jgi:hypothetical protein
MVTSVYGTLISAYINRHGDLATYCVPIYSTACTAVMAIAPKTTHLFICPDVDSCGNLVVGIGACTRVSMHFSSPLSV